MISSGLIHFLRFVFSSFTLLSPIGRRRDGVGSRVPPVVRKPPPRLFFPFLLSERRQEGSEGKAPWSMSPPLPQQRPCITSLFPLFSFGGRGRKAAANRSFTCAMTCRFHPFFFSLLFPSPPLPWLELAAGER